MKKLGKIFCVLILFTLILAPLAAEKTKTITWKWQLTDPNIVVYRYQLDGEAEDGWTTVAGNVDTFSMSGLDPYVDHVLAIQASYDGKNWSKSSYSVAKAEKAPEGYAPAGTYATDTTTLPPESTTTASPAGTTTPPTSTPISSPVATGSTASSDTSTQKAAEIKKVPNARFGFGLELNLGAELELRKDATTGEMGMLFYPRVGLNMDFMNIIRFNNAIGLGLRINGIMNLRPNTADWSFVSEAKDVFNFGNYNFDFMAGGDLLFYFNGKVVNFYVGAGAGYAFSPFAQASNYDNLKYNDEGTFGSAVAIQAATGLQFKINHFLLSLDIDGRWFVTTNKEFTVAATLGLGVKF